MTSPIECGLSVTGRWGRAMAAFAAAATVAALIAPIAAAGAAAAIPPQPSCVSASLNGSALLAGTSLTVSPQPGASDATPSTQISFVGAPPSALVQVRVVGSRSGAHLGRLEGYSQGDGASFVPTLPFTPGETVTVTGFEQPAGVPLPFSFSFRVAVPDPIPGTLEATHPAASEGDVQSYVSRPDVRPPAAKVTTSPVPALSGEEFLAPYGGPGQSGPMILDAAGGLVWFKPLAPPTDATDLQVQRYDGRPVLSWWQGKINEHGFGWGEGVIYDATYRQLATVRAGNGLQADLHELQLTGTGTALISAYEPLQCDLSAMGGPAHGAVTDSLLQEVDVRTGLVRYEWTSLDHVGLNESYTPLASTSQTWPFDFFHLNSINVEHDGSLLISARDTWASYDVDRQTGQILWRLGGKRSSFALGPGVATAWQHDARQLPDGDISLFDNGASPAVHRQSRGMVVHLDATHATASLVAQYVRPGPRLLSASQGNLQALPGGDWLMGWGQLAEFAEFDSSGALLFDAHFPPAEQSYRALRFDWAATPSHPPALAVITHRRALTAYASWNGATTVASWRVLGGSARSALRPIVARPRTGFETAIAVPARIAYVAVQALGAGARVLGTSAVVRG